MQLKHLLIFFIISFSLAIPSLLREVPYGNDSLYYLNLACGKTFSVQDMTPLLSKMFFENVGCNPIVWKVFPCLILFLCCIILSFVGELFDKEKGWLVGLFAFGSFIFVQQAFQFEDDVLAFPILFLSVYFYIKSKLQDKQVLVGKNMIVALLLVCFAGLFWKGAVFYLLVYSFGTIISLAGFLTANWLFQANPINSLMPNLNIGENIPFYGVLAHSIPLLIGIIYIPSIIFAEALTWLALGLLSIKIAFHAIPFLAVGFMELIKQNASNKRLKNIYLLIAIVPLLSMVVIAFGFPAKQDIQAVEFAVEKADGNAINNNWGLGYLITYYNGKPERFGSYTEISHQGLTIASDRDLYSKTFLKCKVLRKFGTWTVLEC